MGRHTAPVQFTVLLLAMIAAAADIDVDTISKPVSTAGRSPQEENISRSGFDTTRHIPSPTPPFPLELKHAILKANCRCCADSLHVINSEKIRHAMAQIYQLAAIHVLLQECIQVSTSAY